MTFEYFKLLRQVHPGFNALSNPLIRNSIFIPMLLHSAPLLSILCKYCWWRNRWFTSESVCTLLVGLNVKATIEFKVFILRNHKCQTNKSIQLLVLLSNPLYSFACVRLSPGENSRVASNKWPFLPTKTEIWIHVPITLPWHRWHFVCEAIFCSRENKLKPGHCSSIIHFVWLLFKLLYIVEEW